MSARVTKLDRCEICDGELTQPVVGRPRRTCSDRCRTRLSRKQRAQEMAPPIRLTPELRQALKLEIDRRQRHRLAREQVLARAARRWGRAELVA